MSSAANPVVTFIQTEAADIVAVGKAAWAQTEGELLTLEQTVLADIKTDIQNVLKALGNDASGEDIETELLNLWTTAKPQIISALSSGAIQILIAAAKTVVAGL